LYFVAYEAVCAALAPFTSLPPWGVPLLGGAAAGALSWLPVYPADVVKTAMQVDGNHIGIV